eukprot:scaffold27.g5984.t1
MENDVPNRTHSRSRSFGSATRRAVSWDELGELGLHRALHEYERVLQQERVKGVRTYKMAGSSRQPRRSILRDVLVSTLAAPLPIDLPGLLAAASWLAFALALVLHQTAVLTIPLALWLLFSSGGISLQLPAEVVAAVAAPSLGAVLPPTLHLPQLPWTGAAGLLLLLLGAEAVLRRRATQQWELKRRLATPASVEQAHAGWAMPPAAAAAAEVQQAGAQQMDQLVAEVAGLSGRVLGQDGSTLRSLGDAVAALRTLCTQTGISMPPGADNLGPDRLLEVAARVKDAVGE